MAATHLATDVVATSSVTTASATLPAGLATGDVGVAAVAYSPAAGALTASPVDAGWTLVETIPFGASFSLLVYRKDLSAADSSTAITVTGPLQKFGIGYSVHRGSEGFLGTTGAEFVGSVAQMTQTNPTLANAARAVAVAIWAERESAPSTDVTAPDGFTMRDEAFGVGGGAVSMAFASNLTEVPSPGPIGGGDWTANVANDAVITYVVGLEVAEPAAGGDPYDGRGLKYHLNRKAGTLNAADQPTVEAQLAANIWAGTTGLDLVGALNAEAGTTGLELAGVLNELAGTTGLEVDGAAASIP